ncbi:hypothetical protein PHYBLDRAFT_141040 [Phycomyces blakesleeanus NRRL 1555(-)]|uniref:Tc1-like transposase DDE domain-containing protein n=1 Tax=Phycomyces blakesleeanus (strain ATCC 8743b / DSM 1359 / FGSC 10004 / NBRC 33097 / NRRL 1555) TaxID=763407 RepID=A0A162UZC9_PHYB8|nr:hypothetical protein PHYBLDRAFT_141040 [Phycomyces blakesleeanus NRRL 1555(-)]OAD78983.1 hypothetical protein PHYBLDRAFT_141040 [Phycomyces blakesleeanus NRRL 1555(-)]|eukprot:XP_018297023.1 hypothetical protein PHYBLDRAFT_141040 [Phycomyces blakesleeanus NRRL 1555(-)]
MDNAPIHKYEDIQLSIERRVYGCVYLPPYFPELNPIEQFLSVVKKNKFSSARAQNKGLSSYLKSLDLKGKLSPKQTESEHNTTSKMENLDQTATTIDRTYTDVKEVEKLNHGTNCHLFFPFLVAKIRREDLLEQIEPKLDYEDLF